MSTPRPRRAGMSEPAADGATPLDPDEAAALIPRHITTHAALNAWEQENIGEATAWLRRRRRRRHSRDVESIRELHRRMFDQTWQWAGLFRQSDKNIGVHWPTVPAALHDLMANVAFWIENSVYQMDELGTRLHHRLVFIHPFPNGNGRHARLYVDDLLVELGHRRFTWGSCDLQHDGDARSRYLTALRAADKNDIGPLLEFVRT